MGFLVALVGVAGAGTRPAAYAVERLDQLSRLGEQLPPLAAALRQHQQARLIQHRGRCIAVDRQELPVNELRFGIAPGVEEELAVLPSIFRPKGPPNFFANSSFADSGLPIRA